MKPTPRIRTRPSLGQTVAECLIAFAILLPVATLVTKLNLQAEKSSRDSVHASHSMRELVNARELIGTWDFDEITVENIQSIPLRENPVFENNSHEWSVTIEELTLPIPSKRVGLSLKRTAARSEFPVEVGPLTFWVPKP